MAKKFLKFKIILLAASALLLHENLFSQMLLSAKVNGKQTAVVQVNDTPAVITINKSDFETVRSFDVLAKDKNASAAYKRSIEITDTSGATLFTTDEIKGQAGIFHVDLSTVSRDIASHKILKIMLMENPANDLMALPSKMKQLAEIHLK